MKLLVIWVQTKKEVDFGLDMPVFCFLFEVARWEWCSYWHTSTIL